MRYTWIDDFLMAKPAVTKDLQAEWNWIRYHVGGKMFAAILLDERNDNVPCYINLKLDPAEGEFLRGQYRDIIPGYYSDKRCWNSVMPDGEVPDALLKELLDKSYRLVLRGFSRKRQREILGLSCCGTKCDGCAYIGAVCAGCNPGCGKAFFMPEGKTCPIYACAVNRHRYASCAECPELPCDIWQATRDPAFTDEEFARSVASRVDKLKEGWG